VILLGLIVGGATRLAANNPSQYVVAADGGKVVIVRGINQSAAG